MSKFSKTSSKSAHDEPMPSEEADTAPSMPAPPAPTMSAPPPTTRYYRVERESVFCQAGTVYKLPAGSVISTLTHDIDEVRAQGAPLLECEGGDKPIDDYGRAKTSAYGESR